VISWLEDLLFQMQHVLLYAAGQPDVATRLFLSKLKRDLRIPGGAMYKLESSLPVAPESAW
jgi:hypothetical protein